MNDFWNKFRRKNNLYRNWENSLFNISYLVSYSYKWYWFLIKKKIYFLKSKFSCRWTIWRLLQWSTIGVNRRCARSISDIWLFVKICASNTISSATWVGCSSWCLWRMLSQTLLSSRIKKLLQTEELSRHFRIITTTTTTSTTTTTNAYTHSHITSFVLSFTHLFVWIPCRNFLKFQRQKKNRFPKVY